MADPDHYIEAADGLQKAADALRACGKEEASEDINEPTPTESQPKTLREASVKVREHFRRVRAQQGA